MPIKVAYDISNLAENWGRADALTGINRVVIEVLDEIGKRRDVDMTAVVVGGGDPLDECTKGSLYLNDRTPAINCGFEYMFYPGWALTSVYSAVFRTIQSPAPKPSSSRRVGKRGLHYVRRVLHKMATVHRMVFPLRVFERKRFDLFHCPHWKIPPRELTGRLPRVFTVYDLIPLVRPEFVSANVAQEFEHVLRRIDVERDWVVSISEFTKIEFCERTGMSPDRVRVAPLAASEVFHPVRDPEAIAAMRARYQLPEGNYFLCLAAPQPRKNLAHLIRSFFRLLDEHHLPDTHLVLAGSKGQGWMYDEIFAAAESSAAHRSRLVFTGYVAEEDLAPLYSGATAFVFPSLYEGFGLPALEALACGTPVITSRTTSLPEVVGDAGVLVDPSDPNELCDAMAAILADHSLRERLKDRGPARAAEFSWRRCAELTAGVYELAAGNARA
jgi:glycosyltransferase involved in cell wall biosynthesis